MRKGGVVCSGKTELLSRLVMVVTNPLLCQLVFTLVFTHDSIYAIASVCHANSVCPSVCRMLDLYQNG